jgi:DNA repair protein RecN (Recombination protein N)
VLHHREAIGRTYEEAVNYDAVLADLDRKLSDIEGRLAVAASTLSEKLRSEATTLEADVERRLASLGFGDAKFEVGFAREKVDQGGIHLSNGGGQYRAFPTGVDRVEFLLSANAGEPPRPLAHIASGGEVSRIMLALKSVLAGSDRVPTLVFDEIDSGISGSIAYRVGKAMKGLADKHQLVVITHLPQIAALADVHYCVLKTTSDDRAVTRLNRLDADERMREVATLLSGDVVTEAALDSARELIREGNRPDSE